MNSHCESIKLIIPKRRTPVGSFSVSDDCEFLFIFKDAVGIYVSQVIFSYALNRFIVKLVDCFNFSGSLPENC